MHPILSAVAEFADPLVFSQFWLSLVFLVPMVLMARAVVAGTRYSAILIIVVFGLMMGWLLVQTGVSTAGLPDFPMIDLLSKTTIIALGASFFVGGQELRRILSRKEVPPDEGVVYSQEQIFMGTGRTQLIFIIRAFFLLLGVETLNKSLLGAVPDTALGRYYPLLAYLGLVVAFILIDHRAIIRDKRSYFYKGFIEVVVLTAILMVGFWIAVWLGGTIALPQIFFVMLLCAGLGAVLYRWRHGPTLRCLLFAGIPVVLAANFIIGGSRMIQAFDLPGMHAVLAYGFFGQVLWMFGGIALLMWLGKTNAVRNLAPGMAGALSHAGLTGACTAGDLGDKAAKRAPIMINIPFIGHVFVFSILAISVDRGGLWAWPSLLIAAVGIGFTARSLRNLRRANGNDAEEVKALMQFSLGWQLVAVFGGLLLLHFSAMPIADALKAQSSSISHFGLFAALQGGMAGADAAGLIAFVFAMPFLVHPLVFFLFGRAMETNEHMNPKTVYVLATIGILGVAWALL